MADTKNSLPEGTDAIIGGGGTGGGTGGTGRSGTAGSGATTSTQTNATGGQTRTTDSSDATDALITGGGTSTGAASAGTSTGGTSDTGSTGTDAGSDTGGSSRGGIRGLVSNAGTKLRDESKTRVHGFASQGLERGSTTLTNIASLVDDTVQQIEDRLGPQYGDYARKASQALNGYATTLQNKDPEELLDDARQLIRKSPAVALTGAAILGFGLARILKVGLEEGGNGSSNRNGDRTGTSR